MRLLWLVLAWIVGIALGPSPQPTTFEWGIIAVLALLASLAFRRRSRYRLLFICLSLLAMGAVRYKSSQPELGPGHVSAYNDTGHRIRLTGVVVAPPDTRDTYVGLRVRTETLSEVAADQMRPAEGLVLVNADRFGEWAYGDRVEAIGALETPPVFETFSYRDYLARQGIYSVMPTASVTRVAVDQANPILQAIFAFRQRGLETILRLYPDPEASLLSGILLGIESGIPTRVEEAFNATGTTHIIAISGFNITIVASVFVSGLGRWLGARRGAWAAALAIAVYTIFVGAGASVVRAAVMAGLALLARRIGRRDDALISLGAASALMTLVNPAALWDVGFQLSFAATLGLVLYADPLKAWFVARVLSRLPKPQAEKLGGIVGEFVLFTLAAQLTTLPLSAYYFHRIPLVALIANPVILPAQPAVMILGGVSAMAGSIWLPLGRPLAWLTWPFVAFTVRAVEFFADWPLAGIELGRLALPIVFGYYLILFGGTAAYRAITTRRLEWSLPRPLVAFGLAGLALFSGLAWRAAVDQPDGMLHLTVFDVGSGDATLIESPSGRFVLINGGLSTIALSDALGRRLPLFYRALDAVVVAGTSEDQLAGLAGVSGRFPIGALVLAAPPSGPAYTALVEEVTRAGRAVTTMAPGQIMDLGQGATFEVIAGDDHGSVLQLVHGRWRAVLAQAADSPLVAQLIESGELSGVQVLVLPDGGFAGVNPPAWLDALRPQLALISVEAGNRRGLPSPVVLDHLAGITVLRTDVNGWIRVSTDGQSMWTEAERLP